MQTQERAHCVRSVFPFVKKKKIVDEDLQVDIFHIVGCHSVPFPAGGNKLMLLSLS